MPASALDNMSVHTIVMHQCCSACIALLWKSPGKLLFITALQQRICGPTTGPTKRCVMQATALARTLGATNATAQGSCGLNTALMQRVRDEVQQVLVVVVLSSMRLCP